MRLWRRPESRVDPERIREIEQLVKQDEKSAKAAENHLKAVRGQRGAVHEASKAITGYIERNGIADALRAAIGGEN